MARVELRHISKSYRGAQALDDVDLAIESGELFTLLGPSGCGKTTLLRTVAGFIRQDRGEVLVAGQRIDDMPAYRRNIGVVLQDVFLFSGSVTDNITLRNEDIPREKVVEAAKLIGMHDFIMRLPGGYDYNVMERGSSLSLGQRQLLSFIRALLYDPSILILDEATSSVDTESELLIQEAIDKLIAGRSSIVIAHRLSTIRKANQIIVLDKGEIREIGTHEQLLSQGGFYAKLHEMQFSKSLPAERKVS